MPDKLPKAILFPAKPNADCMPAIVVCPVPPLINETVPVILDALTVVDKVVQLGSPLASCNTCPLVPLANKVVVLLAD